ncbi:MAG: polysaccharide biosynthesis C-terminal domain-containing protein, partial [Pseudobutyrivibrio sp.]|nr:polysaccharide biosynthesis C-terminal domain-containing protein [Pseudobutyrivibrio sp.]
CLFVFSPFISRVLAPTYSLDLRNNLSHKIKILSFALIFIVEMAVYNSLLKANERFIPGEFVAVNQSIILILLIILLGKNIGPNILVIGFLAYALINLIYLMVCSRNMWRITSGNPFLDDSVKKLLIMMCPLLLGYSMIFVNQQIDKIIVSGLGEGIISAMGYAAVLSNFIATFVGSVCGVSFTYITQRITEGNDEEAAQLSNNSAIQLVTLLLPISVLTIINANDIVTVLFGRGKFDNIAIQNCSLALIGYGFMFVPYVFRELFSRFQYGYGDSKRPMFNSAISIVINIILSVLLSRVWGVLGVTLATSISVFVCAILNVFTSIRKNNYLKSRDYFKQLPRWICGLLVCLVASILCKNILVNVHVLIRLAVIVLLSLSLYLLITFPVLLPLFKVILNKRK